MKSDEYTLSLCKIYVISLLQKKCSLLGVKDPGRLFYCKTSPESMRCCFSDDKCNGLTSFQSRLYTLPKAYLMDKAKVLDHFMDDLGYSSCYDLGDSLDATKCANDCRELEKSDFARNCKRENGLFKCCIRRDKQYCHECRFCCTLPMCTKAPGGLNQTTFLKMPLVKLKTQRNKQSAIDIFLSEETLYKKQDYFCLKPDDKRSASLWERYDPDQFRTAYNQKMLDQAKTHKYNRFLYNFEDPRVLKSFTAPRKSSKRWKSTYGFQYSYFIPNPYETIPGRKMHDVTTCILKCLKMEQSQFARKCHARGGYFKCCINFFELDQFEDARNQLIRDKLIKDKTRHYCKNLKGNTSPCHYCTLDGFCTVSNKARGISNVFYYPSWKKADYGNNFFFLSSGISFFFNYFFFTFFHPRW